MSLFRQVTNLALVVGQIIANIDILVALEPGIFAALAEKRDEGGQQIQPEEQQPNDHAGLSTNGLSALSYPAD